MGKFGLLTGKNGERGVSGSLRDLLFMVLVFWLLIIPNVHAASEWSTNTLTRTYEDAVFFTGSNLISLWLLVFPEVLQPVRMG